MKNIIFDWKRTLYDPDSRALIDGTRELLDFLKSNTIPMVLIGKGRDDMQEEVNRLEVGGYFQKIVFAQGEKDPNTFLPFVSKENPKKTVFIGDRVRSELEIGNKLGATTIWVKQGKFAIEDPGSEDQKPDYTVVSLKECISLMESLI